MKLKLILPAALLAAFAITAEAQRVRDMTETVDLFRAIPQVAPYLESAYGYAVWNRIGRGGLGIGASRGRGQVYVGGQMTGFSIHTEVSIGLQAGGQAYR